MYSGNQHDHLNLDFDLNVFINQHINDYINQDSYNDINACAYLPLKWLGGALLCWSV
jgi:hypothetical protein